MKNNKKITYFIASLYLVIFGFKNIVLAAGGVNCTSWGDVKTDLENVFNFIKIVVPLLVIGLSSYDFIKAITSKDDKGVKKAFYTLLKRLVCAVILYFLPVLINFFLSMLEIDSTVCIYE